MKGTIQAVKQRPNNYSVLINDKWVGDFGQCPYIKGESIEYELQENNGYFNLKNHHPAESRSDWHGIVDRAVSLG